MMLLLLCFFIHKGANGITRKDPRVTAISRATNEVFLETYYVTVSVEIGKMTGSGSLIKNEGGFIVLKGLTLYELIYKNDLSINCFSNFLFATWIKGEDILLDDVQYEKVKGYLISNNDAEKYLAKNSNDLLAKTAKGNFLPKIDPHNPNYQDRCLIYNLLNNNYEVEIDDESGYIYFVKIK
ncbi:hypothetical protein [Taibaiella chishuiensis]|uniref:Uncharacterized protein n=1 Tax=Taibaiella chishuiensis TaxID=1434707 RepID=A0A2P8D7J3_9BACT|nr:hypothetical protein [Taibaiella chishuiensis]PSK93151.1 hypothetical protein B0I18_102121 [Taibaiella chishuiensis]